MLIDKFFNKSEFIIVFVGSLINFVIKSSLVTLNYKFDILPFELFYLLTHIFIFFFHGYFTVKSVLSISKTKIILTDSLVTIFYLSLEIILW